jgi:Arc/MetJ-type ribon-helix-helix transcriptional regulator
MPTDFTSVNVNSKLIEAIQKYIEETGFYRNPTEFVNAVVRQKIEDIHKAQIDKWKLDAFFLREGQIRAKNTDHASTLAR